MIEICFPLPSTKYILDNYFKNIDLKGLQIINLLIISPGPRA